MSPSLLARLRPLMTLDDVERTLELDLGSTKFDSLRRYQDEYGVFVFSDPEAQIIETVHFAPSFSKAIEIYSLYIGMDRSELLETIPALTLPAGESGEPDSRGWIRYVATVAPEGFEVTVGIKDNAVGSIGIARPRYAEVLAERKRREAERREQERLKRERTDRWKSIADPDEMLEDWAAHCSPWGEPPTKFIRYARWLLGATPEERHVAALTWNWDYSHAPLLWMIRQTDCDKATALTVFFGCEPFYYLQFENDRSKAPSHALEMFDFLAEIRLRFARGFYSRSKIAFQGRK